MRPSLFPTILFLSPACADPGRIILQSKGSDTIVNLMARMSEAYAAHNPQIVVAVNGGGSGTGIKSLIDGTTHIANASRAMKPKEHQMAAEHGVVPNELVLAYDGLAVYLHASNPMPSITFEQLACIYAAEGTCEHWSDLGVNMDCAGSDRIIKLNRQNNSGTYEYFKESVLGKKGRFTDTLDQSGTQQVADVISTTPCAIGYGGMGYGGTAAAPKNNVRYACLGRDTQSPCQYPDLSTVNAGRYPFSRPLYLYTNGRPTGAVAAFIEYVLSEDGQQVVLDAGFVPLPEHLRNLDQKSPLEGTKDIGGNP
jgi:phosphate transport system substrate-binding protein